MNTLNISESTYCEVENKLGLITKNQLGVLTKDGFNSLLDNLRDIAAVRLNSCMVFHEELINIVKFFHSVKFQMDERWGNVLTIYNYDIINKTVFNNESNEKAIKIWLLRGMLEDVANIIDEGFRYGMEESEETKLLKYFLFYLTSMTIRLR